MKSVLPKYKDIDKVAMDAAEKIFSSVSSMQAPTISQVQTMLDLGVFKGNEKQKANSLIGLLEVVDERGHKFPGFYDKNSTKSEFICPKGHEFMMRPDCFKRGRGCRKCAGCCPRQAEENFHKDVKERNHKHTGIYKGNTVKTELTCDKNHKFMMSPNTFKRGSGCPKCAGHCPIQAEKNFHKDVKERNYIHSGVYVDTRTKTEITCDKGHPFMMRPNGFKSGQRCPKCARKCPIQAEENFHKDVKKRNHIHTGVYVDTKTKTEITCPEGHPFMMKPYGFKAGYGCPRCVGLCPIQAEDDFHRQVKERNYRHTGIYIDTKTKTELTCDENHSFMMSPDCFKRGQGCPICSNREKKYETFTSEVLTQLGVKFTREKYVKTAKTYRRIDFVLPDYSLFIEIDEAHHKDIIADIEREENIIKALKGTSFEKYEFVRISATQGETFEERTKHIEQELYNIVIDRG